MPRECLFEIDVQPSGDLLQPRRQRDVALQTHLFTEDLRFPIAGESKAKQRERCAADRDVGVGRVVARPDVDTLIVDANAKQAGAAQLDVDDLARQSGQSTARLRVEIERTVDQPLQQAKRQRRGGSRDRTVHSRYPLWTATMPHARL